MKILYNNKLLLMMKGVVFSQLLKTLNQLLNKINPHKLKGLWVHQHNKGVNIDWKKKVVVVKIKD